MEKLRIVFMGTPDFAVPVLDILVKNHYTIVGVITTPDKPAGRGQQLQQSAVKKYALENNLTVLQPPKLKDSSFLGELKSLGANLQIVVAFRMLPQEVWNMPKLGTFNLHASLLPQYRGAAPINWAIINGEKETGVTTFFLQHEIDTGKIIYQEKITILDTDNAGSLHDRLSQVGSNLVLKTIKAIEANDYPQVDQAHYLKPEELLKNAPKIFKEDGKINWHERLDKINDHIRGLSPYPAAWTELEVKGEKLQLKIFDAEKEYTTHTYTIGMLVSDDKEFFKIAVKDGFIKVLELQLAGKKRMKIVEFLRGVQLKPSFIFS